MVLIAFLDDTINKASESDTYATVDELILPSLVPGSRWAQLGLVSTFSAGRVGLGIRVLFESETGGW